MDWHDDHSPYMVAVIAFGELAEKYFLGCWQVNICRADNDFLITLVMNIDVGSKHITGCELVVSDGDSLDKVKLRVENAVKDTEKEVNDFAYLLVRSGESRAKKGE